MEKVMRKVPKEGRIDDFYILLTEWREEGLSLKVIDNDVAWEGEMDSTKVESMCEAMRKRKEEYIVELKHALSDCEKNFTFFIENETFVVKKTDHKSDIKVKFCFVQLHEIPLISTYWSLLNGVLDQEKINRGNISKLSEEVHYLKSEREDLMKQLQQYADEKASLETKLYSKFCDILNTKKEKIISLELQSGAIGDSFPAQHSVHSTHTNRNEKNLQKNMMATKRESRNYPVTKRKCLNVNSVGEPSDLEAKEVVLSSDTPPHTSSTSELNYQNSNCYDSETDIDTDDESVDNNIFTGNLKLAPSSLDIPEKDSKRILPKRVCSSDSKVLPKRVHNSSSIKSGSRDREKPTEQTKYINTNEELGDEFNSQSLLQEY